MTFDEKSPLMVAGEAVAGEVARRAGTFFTDHLRREIADAQSRVSSLRAENDRLREEKKALLRDLGELHAQENKERLIPSFPGLPTGDLEHRANPDSAEEHAAEEEIRRAEDRALAAEAVADELRRQAAEARDDLRAAEAATVVLRTLLDERVPDLEARVIAAQAGIASLKRPKVDREQRTDAARETTAPAPIPEVEQLARERDEMSALLASERQITPHARELLRIPGADSFFSAVMDETRLDLARRGEGDRERRPEEWIALCSYILSRATLVHQNCDAEQIRALIVDLGAVCLRWFRCARGPAEGSQVLTPSSDPGGAAAADSGGGSIASSRADVCGGVRVRIAPGSNLRRAGEEGIVTWCDEYRANVWFRCDEEEVIYARQNLVFVDEGVRWLKVGDRVRYYQAGDPRDGKEATIEQRDAIAAKIRFDDGRTLYCPVRRLEALRAPQISRGDRVRVVDSQISDFGGEGIVLSADDRAARVRFPGGRTFICAKKILERVPDGPAR